MKALKLLLAFACFINVAKAAPNVIFVLTDDLGYGDLYCLHQNTRDNGAGGGIAGDRIRNGSEDAFISTPYLDRMAAEGAMLTRHYTSAPVCAPARGSLLQGKDQGHANIRNNSFDKPIADNHTLGTVMKQAGYYTATVGKWGVGGNNPPYSAHPNDRGFDYFYGYMEHLDGHNHYPLNGGTVFENKTSITTGLDHAYSTDLWTAKAKQIIKDRVNNHSATPFFLYLAYDAPHAQLQVPTQAYPANLGVNGGLQWPLNTNSGTNDSYIHPDYANLGNAARRHATMVRRLDTAMGDVLQTLRDLNIADNTLVVFTSDNGTHDEAGNGPTGVAHNPRNFDSYGNLEGIKRDTWEGGIRVPTFAWWPTKIGDNDAATPAVNSLRPSAFWDWMPTIAEAAGMTPPAWASGVSLLPELTKTGSQLDKGYLYFEYLNATNTPSYSDFPNHGGARRGEMQAIFLDDTDGKRYKGVRTNIGSHNNNFQIYDVDLDPGEGNNLAASKASLQQKMKDKVLQVRTDGDYNRGYLSNENTPSIAGASTAAGLQYKAYTGNWGWVPETGYLTPTDVGTSDGLDLSKRPQNTDFLLEFTGYITVARDGNYTFQMTSDSSVNTNSSGAMMWLHDAHVIDDDFTHNGAAKSGTMRLKAGKHPIRILYKHASGAQNLRLRYSGPSLPLQDVPNTAYSRDEVVSPIPVANPDTVNTNGVNPVTISVLQNDLDDGMPSPLSISAASDASFGNVVINGDTIVYTAEAGKYGTDEFTYTITDGLNFATTTVKVNVRVESGDLWYPLNEVEGTAVAEAGGIIDGTLTGVANLQNAHIVAKHGYGLRLDGVDDQVNLSGVDLPSGNSERTVTAWVRTSATTGTENQVIFGYGENVSGQRFSVRLDTSNASNQRLRLEVEGGFLYGSTKINDGNWHHIAVVVKDFDENGTTNVNETKLYVDGQLETITASASRAMNTNASSNRGMIGGSAHANDYNFSGDIDELKIFNSAKTGAEILSIFNAPDEAAGAWIYRHYGDNAPAMTSDDDNDGFDLLQEYALGGNPHVSDATLMHPAAAFNASTSKLEIIYNRRIPGSHQLTYLVQTSMDVDAWGSDTTELSSVAHPSLGTEFQLIKNETNTTSLVEDKQFVRVKIN